MMLRISSKTRRVLSSLAGANALERDPFRG